MTHPRYTRSRVRPHYRPDGTYVRGHLRNKPASSDQKSTEGADLIGLLVAFFILAALLGPHLPTG